jgi:uncharacterized protein (TIGR02996 family)
MTDAKTLYQAILEHPEDDDVRLVYSDWLEENGQAARAEFIRVQIELAKIGRPAKECHFGAVHNPRLLTPEESRRRKKLQDREQALCLEHEKAWAAELPDLKGIEWSHPRRGFVEEVTAENFRAFHTHAARLYDLVPLRGLHFGPCAKFGDKAELKADSAMRLADFPALARLHSLTIHGSAIGDRGAIALANSPHVANLVSLELSMSIVDDRGARALALSPHLGNLRALLMYMNRTGNNGAAALANSTSLPHLAVINLELNHVGDEAGRAFAYTQQLPELLHLNLFDQFSGELSRDVCRALKERWGDRVEV